MAAWALLFLASSVSAVLKASSVLYAIDCGGDGFKANGVLFKADDHYVGGTPSDFGKSVSNFRFTDIPEVYQTERYDTDDFSYMLPLTKDDKYVLVLKFSEVWFDREGEKVFSVRLGNRVVVDSLDIFAVVGKNSAYDEFVEFELKNNKVYLAGREAQEAYQDGHLKVDFVKRSHDNPKVNGIMIVKGTKENTHYAEQQANLALIAKQKAVIEKDVFREVAADEESDFEEVYEYRARNDAPGYSSVTVGAILLVVAGVGFWVAKRLLSSKEHKP
jgi:outer membrane protein assembly factor BamB